MKREEVTEKVQEIFKEIFDDEDLVVDDNTTADDIEDWDSFEHINLVVAMEREFDVKFPMKRVVVLKNVGEMIDLILEMIV
jgi:acyl carrier protein